MNDIFFYKHLITSWTTHFKNIIFYLKYSCATRQNVKMKQWNGVFLSITWQIYNFYRSTKCSQIMLLHVYPTSLSGNPYCIFLFFIFWIHSALNGVWIFLGFTNFCSAIKSSTLWCFLYEPKFKGVPQISNLFGSWGLDGDCVYD